MVIKTSDLVDHINSLDAKLTVLTQQVNELTAQMSERNAQAIKPISFVDKVKSLFSRG